MKESNEPNMTWLVKFRAELQNTALELFSLLEKTEQLKDTQSSLIKQDLVGVMFCLWRGVFLAHGKNSKFQAPPGAAKKFLRKVIEENTISFADDRNWKEWTANFYVDCAGHLLAGFHQTAQSRATPRLESLAPAWQLHEYPRLIKDRWEYNYENLKSKIHSFESNLNDSNRKL